MCLIKVLDMDRVKRIWYLSPMRAAKVQASLGVRAVSPEPPLLAHTSNESRGTFRQKARSLAPLNGWACAVKICHDGMLEDTNSLDGAHIIFVGFHNRWNASVGVGHPSLLVFIRKLKDGERHERMSRARHGHNDQRSKRKWRDFERRINRLKTEYNNGLR